MNSRDMNCAADWPLGLKSLANLMKRSTCARLRWLLSVSKPISVGILVNANIMEQISSLRSLIHVLRSYHPRGGDLCRLSPGPPSHQSVRVPRRLLQFGRYYHL